MRNVNVFLGRKLGTPLWMLTSFRSWLRLAISGFEMHPLGSSPLLGVVSVDLWPCRISATSTRGLQLIVSCSIHLTSHVLSEWSPSVLPFAAIKEYFLGCQEWCWTIRLCNSVFHHSKTLWQELCPAEHFAAVSPAPASREISCCSSAALYNLSWDIFHNGTINPHSDAPITPLSAHLTPESHQTTSLKFYEGQSH